MAAPATATTSCGSGHHSGSPRLRESYRQGIQMLVSSCVVDLGRPSPISASIETDTFDNERPQGGFFDRVTLVEVDGTNRLAVQTRVEETLRILQLGTLWKRQPHRVLEGLADADDAVVGPDGHPLGAGGLLPLHLFDYARVGAPDDSP